MTMRLLAGAGRRELRQRDRQRHGLQLRQRLPWPRTTLDVFIAVLGDAAEAYRCFNNLASNMTSALAICNME